MTQALRKHPKEVKSEEDMKKKWVFVQRKLQPDVVQNLISGFKRKPAAKGKRSKKRKKNRSQYGCTVSRDDATATNGSDVADTSTAKVKLPPLVVKNAHLNDLIADLASLGVKAEFKLGRVGTKVLLRTKAECDLVVAHLRTTKVEFFTHDIPGEKPFKVVIRGLPNFDPKLIEAEIKNRYKLAPTTVFRMTRRDENVKRYLDCLFLVHFQKGTVTLNALKAIRSINSIIVRWEPYRGGRHDVT
ncbi:uncharacterized protein LOC135710989 [Ochlerotatus camptorhynchus]|uniref:uncharacterized protein LOC135710989 n=1 Tax=Ochlerotatus camptorhynchus TaxID=644619 RepID=UPI0031D156BF